MLLVSLNPAAKHKVRGGAYGHGETKNLTLSSLSVDSLLNMLCILVVLFFTKMALWDFHFPFISLYHLGHIGLNCGKQQLGYLNDNGSDMKCAVMIWRS